MPMRREQVAAALRYLGDKADLRRRAERMVSLDPQEQDLADIAVETGASFVPGVGQALAARDIERARRANDPAGMAMAAAGAIPGGKLAKLLKGFDPTRLELDVYHGTPHRFPATEANPLGEFDASKIGTGEGAQAYGHGIYLAEKPEIAKDYATRLWKNQNMAGKTEIYDAGTKWEKAKSNFLRTALESKSKTERVEAEMAMNKAYENYLQIMKEYGPQFYKADLPDEMIDRMLDWDKPLIEQKSVLKALTEMANRDRTGASAVAARTARSILQRAGQATDSYGKDKVTGASLYDSFLADEIPDQAQRSQFLKDLGIPGIRYADAGSRGKGGSGTRNFVVFPGEEKKVRILERK